MKRFMSLFMGLAIVLMALSFQTVPTHAATDLFITEVTTTPERVGADDEFKLTFEVKNASAVDIKLDSVKVGNSEYQVRDKGSLVEVDELIISGNSYEVTLDMQRTGSSSISIPVEMFYTYDMANAKEARTLNDTITINASTGSSGSPSSPSDSSDYDPVFSLVDETFPVLYKGAVNTVSIKLENLTGFYGKNITVKPDLTKLQAAGFRVIASKFEPSNIQIKSKDDQTFEMTFIVDDSVTEGNHVMDYVVTGTSARGESFTQTIETYFRVIDNKSYAHQVEVSLLSQKPETIGAGDTFTLNLQIANDEKRITAPHIEFGNLPEGWHFVSGTDDIDYDILTEDGTVDFKAEFSVDDTIASGWYSFDVKYDYTTFGGYKLNRIQPIKVYIDGSNAVSASAEVNKVSYPSSVSVDRSFGAGFVITNTGNKTLEDLTVALEENTVFLPKSASVLQLGQLEAGESVSVHYDLVASGDDLAERNYPMTFDITYDYNKSGEMTEETMKQILGVYVVGGEKSESDSKSQPKIIISEYSSDPMIVNAGSEFDLHLTFMNAHKDRTIYNIKAYLTAKETTETTKNNIFIPVNSSNTFYVDQIGPKGTVGKSIRLYAMPDAQPKTYTVEVNFEYEDAEGNAITAVEEVGVNVKQPTKVEMSEITLPKDMMVGESYSLYFDVYNTGRVRVYNLLVKAEGNFTLDPVSKYIGNFEPGYQDYFDGYLIPNEAGPLNGKITLTYDDPTGETIEVVKEISGNVQEGFSNVDVGMQDPGNYQDLGMEDPSMNEGGGIPWVPIIIGVIVVAIVVVVLVLRRRKKRKEGMIFDEDE